MMRKLTFDTMGPHAFLDGHWKTPICSVVWDRTTEFLGKHFEVLTYEDGDIKRFDTLTEVNEYLESLYDSADS